MSNHSSSVSGPSSGADLYGVLGVPPGADLRTIRTAYRRRARETHPDQGGSAEEFHTIQAAWEVLRSDSARAAYDRSRSGGQAAAGDSADDVDAVRYGRGGTWTVPTARARRGAERGAERSASGTAHLPSVYRPDLADPRPLSLPLTSQRVHGDFRSEGLFSRGKIQRRHDRSVEILQRHVLEDLPAARLFNDVLLDPPSQDRRGRRRASGGERAEHVLVCGHALTVVYSLVVPTPAASWDGRVLRAAGRGLALPDLAAQAQRLRETLSRRLLDEHAVQAPLSIGHQIMLHSPDGGLLSPVVEVTRGEVPAPMAAGRAARSIVEQLATTSQANLVDRHLLAVLRDQLNAPDGSG